MELSIDFKIYIEASLNKVWKLLCTEEGLNSWFTSEMEMDFKEGAAMKFTWKDFGLDKISLSETGRILKIRDHETFGFEWINQQNPQYLTYVEFNFKPFENGTALTLRESNFPEGDAGLSVFKENSIGWGQALTMLKFYAEFGVRYSHPK